MTNSTIKISKAERVFDAFNVLLMCALIAATFYPLWYVICASFSDANLFIAHKGILLWPINFNLSAYRAMAKNPMIIRGYINTIYIVLVSLAFNMAMTSVAAYVVSRKRARFSKPVMIAVMFTMYFTGGMIPIYFNIRDLGLLDSYWSVILPGAINTFNMIILKSAFESIPETLEESACLDGAGHYTVLFKIMLPLSKATLSVIMLYYTVAHWNAWFSAMLYLSDRRMFPLQLILREILIQNDTASMTMGVDAGDRALISEIIKYSVIVVATAPVLCIYPFIQKYFEKGVMIGAVKG